MTLNAQQQAEINKSQALQQDFQNKATDYTNQYNTAKGQADQAQGDIGNFNNYMAGAGSAANLYKNAFNDNAAKAGYSQDALNQAQGNVSQAAGAQSAYNDYANTAASKWGMNAGALAAGNANAQAGLNNNLAAATTTLGTQQKAYDAAQNATSQQAGLGVQQQQTQLSGYKNAYDAAATQQKMASDNMTAYSKMAQDQGGLTASQWQSYEQSNTLAAQAKLAMAQASEAMAHAQQYAAQTKISQDQNDFMKQYQTGAYEKAAAPKPAAQASSTSQQPWWDNSQIGTHQLGNMFGNAYQTVDNTLGQASRNAGNMFAQMMGRR